MCARYASVRDDVDLVEEFEAVDATDGAWPEPDYNVAPTKPARIVVNRPLRDADGRPADHPTRQLRVASFGLVPSWSKDRRTQGRMFNARAESIATANAFRRPYALRRCLVPVDGWYEWQVTDGPTKQPLYMTSADGRSLALAGLYEFWGERGQTVTTCTILTVDSTGPLAEVHERMPLVLAPAAWTRWLDPAERDPADLLAPDGAPSQLEIRPVSTKVNKVDNNGPELLARAEPQPSEQRLF
ncbi:MAG: SOS response-associated peptidase [Actinobacteria bacterium]|nr:SOS response-associated peptidase [Actinomycetota bacterium]